MDMWYVNKSFVTTGEELSWDIWLMPLVKMNMRKSSYSGKMFFQHHQVNKLSHLVD